MSVALPEGVILLSTIEWSVTGNSLTRILAALQRYTDLHMALTTTTGGSRRKSYSLPQSSVRINPLMFQPTLQREATRQVMGPTTLRQTLVREPCNLRQAP